MKLDFYVVSLDIFKRLHMLLQEARRIKPKSKIIHVVGFFAALERLDAVVFTAGVGENSWLIREKALDGLERLGIHLDRERNRTAVGGGMERLITTADSPVKAFVIPTNEELVFIEDVAAILDGSYTDHMKFPYSFARPDFACH